MKKLVLLSMLVFSFYGIAQKPLFTSAKVTSVKVYSHSVEISQIASLTLARGSQEIVIKNIAGDVNENTVEIGAPSNITILSVQFTDNYMSEYDADDKSPIIKMVRDSINYLEKEIKKNTNAANSEFKVIELLDKNQQVYGANSGLNVAELAKMTDYYRTKRSESANAYDAMIDRGVRLNELLTKLKNKLEINTKNDVKTSNGKLIIQIMNEVAGVVDFEIRYISNNASWVPFYDLRAGSISEPINLLYKASVRQSTGLDWRKVKLTLSSGNPNQNNQAPTLNPWFLRYRHDGLSENKASRENVVVTNRGLKKDRQALGYGVSTLDADISENQLNITFETDVPYDIQSNGKPHSIFLKDIKIPASYKYFAAPKMDNDAFLLAEITGYSKYNLLKGEANIIFEGTYVGKTIIDPNQTTDTLSLSMGRDKKISIKREKVIDKSGVRFLSGKKEQVFTSDISVRNNKKSSILLTINDQLPISGDKEIEVELLEGINSKVDPESGLMQWDLNLKSGESKTLRISYKLRYPKNKVIDNP